MELCPSDPPSIVACTSGTRPAVPPPASTNPPVTIGTVPALSMLSLPSPNLPLRSGIRNVLTPTSAAAPLYWLPMISNRSENLALSISAPSQNK